MLILDFTKAFDTVHHQQLLMKLKPYGTDSNLHRWTSAWLTEQTQQVVVLYTVIMQHVSKLDQVFINAQYLAHR